VKRRLKATGELLLLSGRWKLSTARGSFVSFRTVGTMNAEDRPPWTSRLHVTLPQM
jgi:hypothetical protein